MNDEARPALSSASANSRGTWPGPYSGSGTRATFDVVQRVERAIRASCHPGQVLSTPTGRGQFSIARIDDRGIVLLLGAQEAHTPLSWECLEGVTSFLRIGGKYESTADAGTLDGYLKGFIKRATAGWVAVVLEQAGIVEMDRRPPARVRLRPASERPDP